MDLDAVLLVDADPSFLRAAGAACEAVYLDTDTASTGEEALLMLSATPYAVVSCASDLSDMAIERFVRQVSAIRPDAEVVLTVDPEHREMAAGLYDLGNVYNHLWKPILDLGDLARQIGRALERRALKRQNGYLLTELRDARDNLRDNSEFLAQVEKLAVIGHISAELVEQVGDRVDVLQRTVNKLAQRKVASSLLVPDLIKGIADCRAVVQSVRRFRLDTEDADLVNVNTVVGAALDFLSPKMTPGDITVVCETSPDLPALHADSSALVQAVTHVAMNAIQAMPEGGTLTVTTEEIEGEVPGVRVSIADTGLGIRRSDLQRVFDPFYTTRPIGVGTGLGLHIARSVVRAHDGDIAIDTSPGKGTTVSLTFPAVRAVAPAHLEMLAA